MYLNKTFVYGNLTRDPEMKSMPTGSKVTSFSLATNRVYKDNNGNKQEQVEFHNIVVFGKQAETSAQYLKKGQGVLIEGRIQTRSWDDKTTGEKKYRTEIVADSVQFGPKTGGTSSSSYHSQEVPESEQSVQVEGKGMNLDDIDFGDAINPDDIPF